MSQSQLLDSLNMIGSSKTAPVGQARARRASIMSLERFVEAEIGLAPIHTGNIDSAQATRSTSSSNSAAAGVYTMPAVAICGYHANPEDQNEMSFLGGELLHVRPSSDLWLLARKDSGETGIVPANFLELLEHPQTVGKRGDLSMWVWPDIQSMLHSAMALKHRLQDSMDMRWKRKMMARKARLAMGRLRRVRGTR